MSGFPFRSWEKNICRRNKKKKKTCQFLYSLSLLTLWNFNPLGPPPSLSRLPLLYSGRLVFQTPTIRLVVVVECTSDPFNSFDFALLFYSRSNTKAKSPLLSLFSKAAVRSRVILSPTCPPASRLIGHFAELFVCRLVRRKILFWASP